MIPSYGKHYVTFISPELRVSMKVKELVIPRRGAAESSSRNSQIIHQQRHFYNLVLQVPQHVVIMKSYKLFFFSYMGVATSKGSS